MEAATPGGGIDWLTFWVAIAGVLGTLVSALLTQWIGGRNARLIHEATTAEEQRTWQRGLREKIYEEMLAALYRYSLAISGTDRLIAELAAGRDADQHAHVRALGEVQDRVIGLAGRVEMYARDDIGEAFIDAVNRLNEQQQGALLRLKSSIEEGRPFTPLGADERAEQTMDHGKIIGRIAMLVRDDLGITLT